MKYKEVLSVEEIEKLTSFFNEADENSDGLLSDQEVKNYVHKFGFQHVITALGWDVVDSELATRWDTFREKLKKMKYISIDQFLNSFANLKKKINDEPQAGQSLYGTTKSLGKPKPHIRPRLTTAASDFGLS